MRRHVVSEVPHAEIDVEEIDTEARRDEWGFPSLAGRLSECGGARASHSEVGQLGQPIGIIEELLRVDVAEAYSPPRVTAAAPSLGLVRGAALNAEVPAAVA